MPFEIVNQTDYLLIKLSGECQGDERPSIQEAFEAAATSSGVKMAIFQCSECGNVSTNFLRQMAQVFRHVKSNNGQMRLVAANKLFNEAIVKNGLDRILVNKMSLRGALVEIGLVKAKEFDVNFINPFLEATQKVFKIQCFLEATPNKPALKKPTDPLLLGDISGIIAISSETFTGTLAISLTEPIFCKIASNMLGEPCDGINEGNVDLVGELANMILGQAKIALGKLGYGIQMALPSCVWGKDHKIKHFGGGICIVLPFETEAGIFYTEVMTNNNLVQQAADKKAA